MPGVRLELTRASQGPQDFKFIPVLAAVEGSSGQGLLGYAAAAGYRGRGKGAESQERATNAPV